MQTTTTSAFWTASPAQELVGQVAMVVGGAICAAALLCALAVAVIMAFPQLVAHRSARVVEHSGEVIEVTPSDLDAVRARARGWGRATLIWACAAFLLSGVGAVTQDPHLIFPALGLILASGLLTAFVAAGYRFTGKRAHHGIPLRHLILTGLAIAVAACAVLVLLSLITASPAGALA